MYSEVSVTWNPLNRLNRKYLALDLRVKMEIRDILKDNQGI